jgi:hypothetical protein
MKEFLGKEGWTNYEAVFNIFLGMLALLGCALLIIFWLVFRKENTIHPIYRSVRSLADPKATLPSQQSPATLQPKQSSSDRETCDACQLFGECGVW